MGCVEGSVVMNTFGRQPKDDKPVYRVPSSLILLGVFVWLLIISLGIKWWWGVFG